ncbi:MAG: 4Fe-4S binding protein [Halanaerobiales bacterium]|nr:4Fe-4S binding protein [Halanaerobiales bacterium]
MVKNNRIQILHSDWCKGCGLCIEVCPVDVLALQHEKIMIKNLEKCISCKNCEFICPDFVLRVVDK